jgi:hypothetical protein
MINVNVNKARDIKKDVLRNERKSKLEALDAQYMKALEQGADTSAIVAKKQQLRDAPNSLDHLTTVDQLKAATLPDVGV